MMRDFEAEADAAAQSIVADYLEFGEFYPKQGGREAVSVGDYLLATLDDEDVAHVLTAVACNEREFLDSMWMRHSQCLRDGSVKDWLHEKHPALISQRVEEMREEAEERSREDKEAACQGY